MQIVFWYWWELFFFYNVVTRFLICLGSLKTSEQFLELWFKLSKPFSWEDKMLALHERIRCWSKAGFDTTRFASTTESRWQYNYST